MATKLAPLLCELHAHTTWSDGALSPRDLVDLYGRAGFDVLAVTDHTVPGACVQESEFGAYLAEMEAEAERARRLYDLLLIPGLELTYERRRPRPRRPRGRGRTPRVCRGRGRPRACFACRSRARGGAGRRPPVSRCRGGELDARNRGFRRRSGAVGAARRPLRALQPRDPLPLGRRRRPARRGQRRLPRPRAPPGWKTLVPCVRKEQAVVDYLRSPRPTFLVHLDDCPDELEDAA